MKRYALWNQGQKPSLEPQNVSIKGIEQLKILVGTNDSRFLHQSPKEQRSFKQNARHSLCKNSSLLLTKPPPTVEKNMLLSMVLYRPETFFVPAYL